MTAAPPPGSTLFGTISIYVVPGGYTATMELRHDHAESGVCESPQASIVEVVNAQTIDPDDRIRMVKMRLTPRTEVERACEICGAEAIRGCTNKRCPDCHGKWCTPGGSTTPGHGRKWPPGNTG